ncbi:hypothetical protein PCASD_26520 [Puccinia coronata f. sp. avenae]|uniref:Uncharacterized protein n=1 Tax=Puccinia coronata f. sp. avenae TaxID=200324 RepID=A0A2N5S2P9_9BASI|nr:hypothetical protein PCASD_26520 [Puccinia coronata f. sp. avenae]
MNTRQSIPGIHVPITNPEAILRAGRAEQRRVELIAAHQAAELAAQRAARVPIPVTPALSPPRIPSPTRPQPPMQESTAPLGANLGIPLTTPAGSALVSRTPSADPPNRTNPSTDSAEAAATRKAIRVMIATQKASIIQSQTDRKASTELSQPLPISLALQDSLRAPICLHHEMTASSSNPKSTI